MSQCLSFINHASVLILSTCIDTKVMITKHLLTPFAALLMFDCQQY